MLEKFGRILAIISILIVISAIGTTYSIIYFSRDLPNYKQLEEYDPPTITRIYSNSGNVIAEYAKERRIYIGYNDIPKLVINAFLAAEDKNFFHHQGIDIYSLVRATLQSIVNIATKKRAIGGSTITQQVVKYFLLSNERTITRKIKEAILAYRVTKIYSKEKILELYLNQIYLGNNSYGIAAAARSYFGKDIRHLDISEIAMLAALPKAPSALNPFIHYDKAKGRRDWVISRMTEEKMISDADAIKFSRLSIALNKKDIAISWANNFYIEAVRQELIGIFGEEALYNRGLIVNTYFNDKIQQEAEKALRKGIIAYDRKRGWRGPVTNIKNVVGWEYELKDLSNNYKEYKPAIILENHHQQGLKIGLQDKSMHILPIENFKWANKNNKPINKLFNLGDIILVSKDINDLYHLEQLPEIEGGMIIIEPNTGCVLAIIGGYDFSRSNFNRVTQAKRQPGSAFKPFVYLAALEDGYKPNAILIDDQITVPLGYKLPDWQPKNFGGRFLGSMTMRTALEKSRNIPTVRIILEIGLDKITQLSQRFKIYDKPVTNYSVALGASETTLLKLTNAYNTIASQGLEIKPKLIDSVYDRKGNLLYKNEDIVYNANMADSNTIPELQSKAIKIISEDLNYQITSMLNGAMERGTGAKANILKKTIAGKTGTTNNSQDAWFVGFTPYITAGIYVGYDIPKGMGRNESGATIALPIFIDFMSNTTNDLPNVDFAVPDSIKLNRINKDTGRILNDDEPSDGNTILEAFKESDFNGKIFSNKEYPARSNYDINSVIDSIESE